MQILCATDFSPQAKAAADVAAGLARRLHFPLRLVHCGPDFIITADLPYNVPDNSERRELLEAEALRLRCAEVEVITQFRTGIEWAEIVTAAEETPTQMIVLGSTGKGLAERWLIGSVAERVAESAPVPTLVIRQPEPLMAWLQDEAQLRLLCAVDFTASADAAVTAVKELIAIGQIEVEAAYLRPEEEPSLSEEQRIMRQRDVWERVHAVLGDVPVKVHVRDAPGQAAAEFLHTAQDRHAGLLVVGTHQRHGWDRFKTSSFSRRALTHATSNVLCAPSAGLAQDTRIPPIHRVLLATDFSDVCIEAFRHAHGLLPRGGAIHLVHVCHQPSTGVNPVIASEVYFDHSMATAKAEEEAKAKMKAFPPSLLDVPGVVITTAVLASDDIAATIWNCAKGFGADIICVGTKQHSRVGAALLGSTVQALLTHALKPVFVVPPPGK